MIYMSTPGEPTLSSLSLPSSPPTNVTSPPPHASVPPPAASPPPPHASVPPPAASPPPPHASVPPPAAAPPPLHASVPPPAATPPPHTTTPPAQAPPPTKSPPLVPPPPSSTPYLPSPLPPPPSGGTGSDGSSSSSDNKDGGISTPVIIGIAAGGGLIFALLLSLLCICCFKKKKKNNVRRNDGHYQGPPPPPPPQPQADKHGGLMQQNPPPPAPVDHVVNIPPKIIDGPSINTSGGSRSTHSGGETSTQTSSGMAFPFEKSLFSYDELEMATDGFSEANLLGQGGFGYVHRGVLPNGKEVAIKQMKAGSGQGEREFQAEVEIISRVHHKHLVSLVGYCTTGSQRMLVYEFVPNNTLEFHLHGKGRPTMDWGSRLKIALGSANGLAYLHEDCHPKIIHRDIKASNILMDFNFAAKVADFGLARFSPEVNTHVSTRVMGTFGYLAPEYAASGKLTDKSDLFSFGVVLLELITGRRPVDSSQSCMGDSLVDWARPLLSRALQDDNFDALVDLRIRNEYNKNEMARMVACAAACVRHSAKRRPRMSQVVRALEGDLSLSDLNEGMKPGHSTVYGTYENPNYDAAQYNEDMKKLRKTALASQECTSRGAHTSEYGLNPSSSSSEH